jgi:hypothetical protein
MDDTQTQKMPDFINNFEAPEIPIHLERIITRIESLIAELEAENSLESNPDSLFKLVQATCTLFNADIFTQDRYTEDQGLNKVANIVSSLSTFIDNPTPVFTPEHSPQKIQGAIARLMQYVKSEECKLQPKQKIIIVKALNNITHHSIAREN